MYSLWEGQVHDGISGAHAVVREHLKRWIEE